MLQYQILNAILIAIQNEKRVPTVEGLIMHEVPIILENFNIKDFMIVNSIKKVLKDGYIESQLITEYNQLFSKNEELLIYKLTWEGQLFIFEGGYIGKHRRENSEKERVAELERVQQETNKRMVILTRYIAGGTIIAAIYYLIEIYRTLFVSKT